MTNSRSKHPYRYQKFLKLLRTARKEAGYTQNEVAETLGEYQSYISKVECGERRMDVVEFIDYMKAISTNPTNIIEELRRPYPKKLDRMQA